MATYSRNNLPAVRETPAPLASRDIGEIIVRSLTTVQESLNEEHVPVNKRDIEDAIVKGINRSELNKKYKPGGIGGKGSSPDSEVEKYYRENGGIIVSIGRVNCAHHPHGLDDNTPIIEFVEKFSV